MSESPAPLPADAPIDRDLYCLTCGYNLRGLSGDPVRCPECGDLNPIGDVEIPAEIIKRQLRKMETSPAICVGATLFGGPLLVIDAIITWENLADLYRTSEPCGCLALPTLIAVGAWIICSERFRRSCLGKPGWVAALALYHFWSLSLIGVMIAAFAGYLGLASAIIARLDDWTAPLVYLGLTVVLAALMMLLTRWAYRRAIAPLHALQREVAVTMARDESRRRMQRAHRRLFK